MIRDDYMKFRILILALLLIFSINVGVFAEEDLEKDIPFYQTEKFKHDVEMTKDIGKAIDKYFENELNDTISNFKIIYYNLKFIFVSERQRLAAGKDLTEWKPYRDVDWSKVDLGEGMVDLKEDEVAE